MLIGRIRRTWNRRLARPDPAALAAVNGQTPAVVVTGGSRGIGREIARCFAAGGHAVVLIARGLPGLEEAAEDILSDIRTPTDNARVLILPLDIADSTAPAALDAFLSEHGLYPDTLVNNAGMGLSGGFHTHGADDVAKLVALNVAALTRLMHHVLPGMLARAEGGVLNVASLGGLVPGPYQAAYYASKAYVISLNNAVAHEISGRGVRLSVLAPGPVDTTFHAAMGADWSLYRWIIPSVSAAMAARAGYQGVLYGQRLIAPGLVGRLLALGVQGLPPALMLPIIGVFLAPRR